jgi:hypothetical protein
MKAHQAERPASPVWDELETLLSGFSSFAPLGSEIEAFWLLSEHQASATWAAHRDINEVMLATALRPEGFLVMAEA